MQPLLPCSLSFYAMTWPWHAVIWIPCPSSMPPLHAPIHAPPHVHASSSPAGMSAAGAGSALGGCSLPRRFERVRSHRMNGSSPRPYVASSRSAALSTSGRRGVGASAWRTTLPTWRGLVPCAPSSWSQLIHSYPSWQESSHDAVTQSLRGGGGLRLLRGTAADGEEGEEAEGSADAVQAGPWLAVR